MEIPYYLQIYNQKSFVRLEVGVVILEDVWSVFNAGRLHGKFVGAHTFEKDVKKYGLAQLHEITSYQISDH